MVHLLGAVLNKLESFQDFSLCFNVRLRDCFPIPLADTACRKHDSVIDITA